jgi:predicted double-glycine peptidase
VVLPIPDTRQDTPHGCGEAAVRCVLNYHKILAAIPRFATPQDGSDPRQLEAYFRRLGLHVLSGEMKIGDLKHFCNEGRPPVVLVHWDGDRDSHYVVVRGVSRGRVYYQDVETGPGSCSLRDWRRAWSAEGRLGEIYRTWAIVGWPA